MRKEFRLHSEFLQCLPKAKAIFVWNQADNNMHADKQGMEASGNISIKGILFSIGDGFISLPLRHSPNLSGDLIVFCEATFYFKKFIECEIF